MNDAPAAPRITRDDILTALQATFEPLGFARAMWQAGSAAFGRDDAWSDIDLQIVVDDERVEETLALAERALVSLGPLRDKWVLPQPTWHGHSQVFYRLRDSSEFLWLDLVVLRLSATNRFLEPELHGVARVLFDKAGVVRADPIDPAALARRLDARRETLRDSLPLFHTLVLKELRRGRLIEAVSFYQNNVLRSLIEALRLRHAPARHHFNARLIYSDLPADVLARLEPLTLPRDAADLERKLAEAQAWTSELLA